MSNRTALALSVLCFTACQPRVDVYADPDAAVDPVADAAPPGDSVIPGADFGFFVPDVPPPADRPPRPDARDDAPPPVCGNARLERDEICDDGNTRAGDGCSPTCTAEPEFVCPQPGQACDRTVVCGDHKVTGNETCDDGNTADHDGCSASCTVEPGWSCQRGAACRTECGDGIKVGARQCDDENLTAGDGCSPTCIIESPGATEGNGWVCPTPGQPCVRTTCGDGLVEGSEQCDDGNNDTGDGCSPFCRREPICPPAGGPCSTACGDGLLLASDVAAGQECDDGNTVSGDGCSADCKLEKGFQCEAVPVVHDPLQLPIVYRDFKAAKEAGGHPDFERFMGDGEAGIVLPVLSTSGKPVHVAGQKKLTVNNDAGFSGFDYFRVWYQDDPTYNKTINDFMTFTRLPGGAYQYANTAFFPLDGRGWGNYLTTPDSKGIIRNFHFTSELRYWFEYQGDEKLDFTGDDDVWVFINKKLAVDLGGLHEALNGTVTLNASDGAAQVCDLLSPCPALRTVDLGLQVGRVYEIVVFQAERHTEDSSYKLTLSNFSGTRSSCRSVCGDGVVTADEACDLGRDENTGDYGTCNPDCTLPPGCGDGVVNGNEQCDDGFNLATYGGTTKICGPGCVWAGTCGDGVKNGPEECDLGADNSDTSYGPGRCTKGCMTAPFCGDGQTQPENGEECDGEAFCNDLCKKRLVP